LAIRAIETDQQKKLGRTRRRGLCPASVSGKVGRYRTVVLTICRPGRPGATSDVGRNDQNGSKKTRRVKPLRLSRLCSRACPI
jgi:hypothetical protein